VPLPGRRIRFQHEDRMTTQDDIKAAVATWLRQALDDAERRGLPGLKPLLEGLAASTVALRLATWNDDIAAGREAPGGGADAR
jgi:hypothetical protein